MKKIFTAMILGSFALMNAEQYGLYQSNASNNNSAGAPRERAYPYGGDRGVSYNNSSYSQSSTTNKTYDTSASGSKSYQSGDSLNNPSNTKYHQLTDNYEKSTHSSSASSTDQLEEDTNKPVQLDISKKIYDSLSGYISTGNQNISFELNNGIITLSGNVNTQEEKDKIENDLKKLEGVKQIINNIKVTDSTKVAYYQPTADNSSTTVKSHKLLKDYAALDNDKKINSKIREKLDNRGFEEVSIITANGVVTLGGVVNSADEFVPLVIEIEKIEGVKKVNNKVSPKK